MLKSCNKKHLKEENHTSLNHSDAFSPVIDTEDSAQALALLFNSANPHFLHLPPINKGGRHNTRKSKHAAAIVSPHMVQFLLSPGDRGYAKEETCSHIHSSP